MRPGLRTSLHQAFHSDGREGEGVKILLMDKHAPGAWVACGNECSGYLIFTGREFKAERSIENYFAALGKGQKGPIGSPRRRNGRIAPEIFLLAAVRSKELNPSFAKRCRMAHCMSLVDGPDIDRLIDDEEFFDKYAGAWFVRLVRVSENGISIAGKWVESIEERLRDLTDAEDDFLRSVQEAATDLGTVPFQAAVRSLWLLKDCDRPEDSFSDVRDALGFRWLPKDRPGRRPTARR